MQVKFVVVCIILLVLLFLLVSRPKKPYEDLVVFSITDVYALDNLPKVKTFIQTYLKKHKPKKHFTVIQGDFLSPSLLSAFDKGASMIQALVQLPVHMLCLGNHEFDHGEAVLKEHLKTLTKQGVKVLNCNIAGLEEWTVPSVVYKDFYFTGACMEDAMKKSQGSSVCSFSPLNETVLKMVSNHSEKTIIALTHQIEQKDVELLKTGKIDVVLGGHEHHPIQNKINGKYLLKPGSEAENVYVVHWKNSFEPFVKLFSVKQFRNEQRLLDFVRKRNEELQVLETVPLLKMPFSIDQNKIRKEPNELVTSLLDIVQESYKADYVFIPSGGIRSNASGDTFSVLTARSMFPFENRIICLKLPLSVLYNVRQWSESIRDGDNGGYLHWNTSGWRLLETDLSTDVSTDIRLVSCVFLIPMMKGMDNCVPLIQHFKNVQEIHEDDYETLFLAIVESIVEKRPQFIKEYVRKLDKNGDGIVSKNELVQSGTVTNQLFDSLYGHMLRHWDTNKDDTLSVDEL
jgi:2',3'-cyclic-nucleotide 2'-phosphodiesterase (5'-nucleotidase family)